MDALVLASTSPYRRGLLRRLGVPFACVAPTCDEEALKQADLPAADLAMHLARAKARSVVEAHPDAAIIGSDQIAHLDGRILGKPGTRAAARAQLSRLAGRPHELLTAVCLIHRGQETCWTDRTLLHMAPLEDDQIAAYVDRDEPLDCAGSYKLEAGGIALFASIDSADHTAITGLPLLRLANELRQRGWRIPAVTAASASGLA